MSGASVFPLWVFATVALAMALVAFVAGQIHGGVGMVLTLAASSGWITFVQYRARKTS